MTRRAVESDKGDTGSGSTMIQTDPLLVVSDLTKVYRGKTPTTAVDRLSFSLGRGEVLGLLGPNGAGKTTTIQMLLSALEPTSGRIEYFGKELKSARHEILSRVGFASAYSRLPTRLSVAENLDVFGRLYGLPRSQRKNTGPGAAHAVRRVGLAATNHGEPFVRASHASDAGKGVPGPTVGGLARRADGIARPGYRRARS